MATHLVKIRFFFIFVVFNFFNFYWLVFFMACVCAIKNPNPLLSLNF